MTYLLTRERRRQEVDAICILLQLFFVHGRKAVQNYLTCHGKTTKIFSQSQSTPYLGTTTHKLASVCGFCTIKAAIALPASFSCEGFRDSSHELFLSPSLLSCPVPSPRRSTSSFTRLCSSLLSPSQPNCVRLVLQGGSPKDVVSEQTASFWLQQWSSVPRPLKLVA